ncbi:kinesin-like protein KIF20B isoform X2 [Amblyraja radiata]|uniref:kinesin-like protein KIF20B isoform X2 n=1 Tax=Amblyraja radiata TaxID=386614 RepID=UPI00140215BA|nr:kinesin-like protein KIF20B isoform X2 [Amblyraja radiata]
MEPILDSKYTFMDSHGIVNDEQEIPTSVNFDDIRKDLIDELSRERSSNASHVVPDQNSAAAKDHMCVYLRIRPFTESEIAQNESQDCVLIENPTSVIFKAPQYSLSSRCSDRGFGQMAQHFTFSHVYGPETKQTEIFGVIKPFIEEVLNGQNCLVFTYGVTNSGKTYTFQGPAHDVGILPRAMSVLFRSIEGNIYQNMNIKPQRSRDFSKLTEMQVKEEEALKNSLLRGFNENEQYNQSSHQSSINTTEGSLKSLSCLGDIAEHSKYPEEVAVRAPERTKFSIWVSFCEIYNEAIYDLLDPVSCKLQKRNILRLVQDAKGNTYVKDLKWIQVSNAEEACRILKRGRKQQKIASTKVNNLSSRSHCTFSIRVLHVEPDGLRVIQVSELSLCDLAGSERNAKTKNDGDRLKEAGNINTSLLILGKCINALRHNQISKTHGHVPFRESKLTRYFQGFFSGRGKVRIIVNISQCASMYEETLNVLKFSAMAQKILLDCSKHLPARLFPKRSARALSLIINNAAIGSSLVKRGTISWDALPEDVVEMEECDSETIDVIDLKPEEEEEEEEDEEGEEEEEEEEEEENIVIGKKNYEKLLVYIQDLKNKIIVERKEKVILEKKIREEVCQEMEKFMSRFENDLSEHANEDSRLSEDRIEKRNDLFQTLVKTYAAIDQIDDSVPGECSNSEIGQLCKTSISSKHESLVNTNVMGYIKSLEPDVAEIKKHAEIIRHHLASAPDPEETIAQLEANLACVIEELNQTKEILNKNTADAFSVKTLEQKVEGMKNELTYKESALTTLNKEIQFLKDQLDLVQENFTKEHISKDELNQRLKLELTSSAETVSKLTEQIGNQNSNYEKLLLELNFEKEVYASHSQKTKQLQTEIELGRHEVAQRELQNKALEDKINKLSDFQKESEWCALELKHAKDLLENTKKDILKKTTEIESLQKQISILAQELDQAKAVVERRDSPFHKTIERLQREREVEIQSSSQKKQLIQELDEELKSLKKQREDFHTECTELKGNETITQKLLQEKDAQFQELKTRFKETENKMQVLIQSKENTAELEKEVKNYQCIMEARELELSKNKEDLTRCEEQLKERGRLIDELQNSLKCREKKCLDLDKYVDDLKLNVKSQEIRFEKEVRQEKENRCAAEEKLSKKVEELESKHLEFKKLRSELAESASKCQKLSDDLNRKDEEYRELKEKYVDAKKQIQWVETDISTKREEEKSLRNKVSELERLKNQMIQELETKERMIQQFKKVCSNEANVKKIEMLMITLDEKEAALRKLEKLLDESKTLCQVREQQGSKKGNTMTPDPSTIPADIKIEETAGLLQTTSKELQDKERIIQDMKSTLTEQEQTQTEQDELLEVKLKQIEELNAELDIWRRQAKEFEKKCDTLEHIQTVENAHHGVNSEKAQFQEEIEVLKKQLLDMENNQRCNREKWLNEKKLLFKQAKEAEDQRNKEMRKWTEEREHYSKLQSEMENLTSEMIKKEKEMLKWREERDSLVRELEVQLSNLINNNKQKDEEIKQLKASAKEYPVEPETVLDSSEVSTENGTKTSRFPKPELEIQFTPLQPNKLSVKEASGNLISVKIPRPNNRKRKSFVMEESGMLSTCWKKKSPKKPSVAGTYKNDDCENKKYTVVSKNIHNASPSIINIAEKGVKGTAGSLEKNPSVSSLKSHKKDGTLQKIGDLLQNSPTLLQNKAKRFMETLSAPKNLEIESSYDNSRPKRTRRKLYKQEISSPMYFPSQPIMELTEKESDHLIMKRRLRTRTTKMTR